MDDNDFTFAPQYEYPGQWFDDMGASLLALGSVGLAWDMSKADIPRGQLDEIILRLANSGATQGDLTQ